MANANWPPRVALITGAASGLGFQLAVILAREGVAILAVDVSEERLQLLERELAHAKVATCWAVADVTDAAALRQAVSMLEQRAGPIDLLIASAGVGVETPALAFDPDVFAKVIQVNLIGVANSIAAVLPGMLAQGRGQLVAISSLASYRGLPFMAAYCASKSGLNALIEAVRVEVSSRGIVTTIVCPGWVRTPMTTQLSVPIPNMLEVEDAGRRILWAIRKGKKFQAFPRATAWLVRLLRWLPAGVSDWVIGRMMRRLQRRPR